MFISVPIFIVIHTLKRKEERWADGIHSARWMKPPNRTTIACTCERWGIKYPAPALEGVGVLLDCAEALIVGKGAVTLVNTGIPAVMAVAGADGRILLTSCPGRVSLGTLSPLLSHCTVKSKRRQIRGLLFRNFRGADVPSRVSCARVKSVAFRAPPTHLRHWKYSLTKFDWQQSCGEHPCAP